MRAVLEAPCAQDLESMVRALVSMGTAPHAAAPRVHAALTQALLGGRSRSGEETERPDELASGRLGEELIRLLLAYLRTPRA